MSKTSKRAISIFVIAILALSFAMPFVSVSASPDVEVTGTSAYYDWTTDEVKVDVWSLHVNFPLDVSVTGIDVIATPTVPILLSDITEIKFWEYVVNPGGDVGYPVPPLGNIEIATGITLYLDMNDDGVFDWVNDAQIVLECPKNDPLVLTNLNTWDERDAFTDGYTGFDKGGGELILPSGDITYWKTTAYSTYDVLSVGLVLGWGNYGNYEGYLDDITVNGVTYPLTIDDPPPPSGPGFTIDYVTPGDVDYGDVLTVMGSGVTAGSVVKVFWDYASGTYVHLLNTTEGNPDGTFDCEVKVPSDVVGPHYLWVTDVSTAATISHGPITMVPKISLSPKSGLYDDPVTVKGYGFSAESDVTITFNAAVLTTAVETDELGYFTYDFDVPIAAYATYPVVATDELSYTDSADFTVGASLSLDVEEGPEGTRIEISGIGFPPGALGDVNWDGVPMTIIGDPVTIPTSGKFTVEVVAPSTGEGDHTIMIYDTATPKDVEATFTIDGVATIEVEPTYGAPGSTITLTGANFTQIADTEVVLTLIHLTLPIPDAPLGTVETESDGTFETTFTSPAVTFENYKVEAVDAVYGLNALDSFKVGMIAMIINPTYGPSGSDVSLTGVGYAEGDFNMTFGEVLFEYEDGVDAGEIIAETFYVPTLDPGTYDVTVVDEVGNELTAQFTVTAKTYVVFDPTQAPNEYDVIIEGYHFSEDPAADLEFILYNSTDFWDITADVDEYDPEGDTDPLKYLTTPAELDADGNFSAWWTVPIDDDLSLGDYTLNVTAEDTFIQASFSVVTARVDVAPRKALFDRGDTLQFNVKNDFDFEDSYMKIWDPYDNLYWQTEEFDTWLKVGTLYTVPYYLQTSGKNPMILAQDAPLGTWFWIFYETGTTQLVNGTFEVGPSTAAQVEEKLTEIWGSIDDLTENIDDITDEIEDDIGALADDISDVASEVDNLRDDIVADLADDIAAAADAAEGAADAVSDLAGLVGDIADVASDAKSSAEDAANAATDAKTAAEDSQQTAQGLTTLVYGAIAASLIAALAAVVSLMQISKKIA